MGKSNEQRARLNRAERRLKKFYQPGSKQLDAGQIESSRDFHIEHWLRMAETMIRKDHQASYYGGLTSNLEATLADHPGDDIPIDLQQVILRDLAFLEGHVEAFRYVNRVLQQARSGRGKEQARANVESSHRAAEGSSPRRGSPPLRIRAYPESSRQRS